jgi:hypothetical protein
MQAMTDQAVSWSIEGSGANLKCGMLDGYAGCTPHGSNFVLWKWNGRPGEGIFVHASAGPRTGPEPCEIDELYVRGNDFIGNYSVAGPHRIAQQVYWRASEDRASSSVAIELILSIRTELLDSKPELCVTSYFPGAMLYHTCDLSEARVEKVQASATFERTSSAAHLFIFRSVSLGLMYAQMVHPSDFVSAKISFDGTQPLFLDATLFPERLEKGVIRRGRVGGWFLPAENDLQTAVELARRFVDEELPLTT